MVAASLIFVYVQATQYHKNQIQRRYLVKIILKYIITNVKERKLRSGVMLLSILLSTTLLFVSFPSAHPMKVPRGKWRGDGRERSTVRILTRPAPSLPRTFRICQPLERRLAY